MKEQEYLFSNGQKLCIITNGEDPMETKKEVEKYT